MKRMSPGSRTASCGWVFGGEIKDLSEKSLKISIVELEAPGVNPR
jgi:hypothetical protein